MNQHSQHGSLVNHAVFGETREPEQRCVDQIRLSGENKIAENLACSWGVHDAVSAKTVGQVKTCYVWRLAQNSMIIRGIPVPAGRS